MEPNWIKFSITDMDMELWKDPFNEMKYTLKTNLGKVLVKDPMGPTKRRHQHGPSRQLKMLLQRFPFND